MAQVTVSAAPIPGDRDGDRDILVVVAPLQPHQLPLLLLVAALELGQAHPHLHLLRVQLLHGRLQRAHLGGQGGFGHRAETGHS